jgi:enoyl-CoA hydratase
MVLSVVDKLKEALIKSHLHQGISMPLVNYEVRNRIAEIALDHPPVNALTEAMLDELLAALAAAAADPLVRAVILRSNVGQRFCAGLNLEAVASGTNTDLRALVEKLYVRVCDAQRDLGKPSIAVVNGAARGGGMTLAISCDLILAGRSATFGYPEIDVGLIPAIHYAHLPRIVGRYRAFDLLFTGRSFGADEAAALGLVSRVVEDDRALDRARALARVLAAKPAEVLERGGNAFRRENDTDYRVSVAAAVDDFCAVASTEQAREGVRAFLEKRKPEWALPSAQE